MTTILSGGIGKTLAFSAFIPKLSEKYGPFNIMSPWPDLFEGQEGIRRSIGMGTEYGYEDYFKGQDRFAPEPYNNNDFFKKRISLLEAIAKEFDLEYEEERDLILPPMYFDGNSRSKVDEIAKNGKYIVVQFMGGNQAQNNKLNDKFMAKDYPPNLIEEFILAFTKKYKSKYQIVNYGLPFEFNIANTVSAADISYCAAAYLLSKAETFVAIDSNLQHFSACKGIMKKGIVLWGATSPLSFGYKHNVNLVGNCPFKDLHCTRPYFQHTSDVIGKGVPWSCKSKECINIPVESIMKELESII